jgi:hypothetical protein
MLPIRFKSDIQMRIIGLILAFLFLYFTWAYLPGEICFIAFFAYLYHFVMLFEMRPEPYDLPPSPIEPVVPISIKEDDAFIQETFMTDADYPVLKDAQIAQIKTTLRFQVTIAIMVGCAFYFGGKDDNGNQIDDSVFYIIFCFYMLFSIGNFFLHLRKIWLDKQSGIKKIVIGSAKLIDESDGESVAYYINIPRFRKIKIDIDKEPFRNWQHTEWRMDTVRRIELHLAPESETILSIKLLSDIL